MAIPLDPRAEVRGASMVKRGNEEVLGENPYTVEVQDAHCHVLEESPSPPER